MGNPDNKMKRMITKGVFCMMCVLSVFISCDDDDDDHHHDPNWAYRSIWREEQHKEYEVCLSSELLPVFHDAMLKNPVSGGTRLNDFAANMRRSPDGGTNESWPMSRLPIAVNEAEKEAQEKSQNAAQQHTEQPCTIHKMNML